MRHRPEPKLTRAEQADRIIEMRKTVELIRAAEGLLGVWDNYDPDVLGWNVKQRMELLRKAVQAWE